MSKTDHKDIVRQAYRDGSILQMKSSLFSKTECCFQASHFVDWMSKFYKMEDREEAIKIAKDMYNKVFIVGKTTGFEDGKGFYQFARKPSCLVVGGGFAGIDLVRGIPSQFWDVTLLTKNRYFQNNPTMSEFILNQKLHDIRVSYERCAKNVKVIEGEATSISPTKIELKDGSSIVDFDYLVCSIGCYYDLSLLHISDDKDTIPVISGTSVDSMLKYAKEIEAAKKVTVIGTGPIGIEILGSLLYKYPNKEYTIVSSRDKFLDRACSDAHEFVQKHFTEKQVICKMLERVKTIKGNKVITDKGEIEADVAFSCIGFFPVKDPIEKGMPDSVEKGFLKVNSKLQVEGFTHMFAAGDITNIKEEKLAQNAENHAHVVIENLKRSLVNKELSDYKSAPRAMLIRLSPKNSLLIHNNKVYMDGFLPNLMKDLAVYFTINNYK